ncbi:MAG TPA: MBL fold metallo-hydrolase [Candidatus Nanoarchaeia archaeon]|nr:MBL fold metallo-hydrolase [Candidatus Nanoarchaeia archaeon]
MKSNQLKIKNTVIEWLGHASFKVKAEKSGKVIYFDPFQISTPSEAEKADIILISHPHYDHCSPDDLKKIVKKEAKETAIVTVEECIKKLSEEFDCNFIQVSPGKKIEVNSIKIEAVPAYNPGKKFHPKSSSWVGFVVDVDGVKIYHAGDTDAIPEIKNLREMKIDVALVPVGGTYTMTAEEASEAVNSFKPKIAVPMHFGKIVGNISDAERFKKLAKVEVAILE